MKPFIAFDAPMSLYNSLHGLLACCHDTVRVVKIPLFHENNL